MKIHMATSLGLLIDTEIRKLIIKLLSWFLLGTMWERREREKEKEGKKPPTRNINEIIALGRNGQAFLS